MLLIGLHTTESCIKVKLSVISQVVLIVGLLQCAADLLCKCFANDEYDSSTGLLLRAGCEQDTERHNNQLSLDHDYQGVTITNVLIVSSFHDLTLPTYIAGCSRRNTLYYTRSTDM